MSHRRASAATTTVLAVLAACAACSVACSDPENDGGTPEVGVADGGVVGEDAVTHPDALPLRTDASLVVPHDSGAAPMCNSTCECAQGLACVNNECTVLANPVYCCEKQGCPSGQACLDQAERPMNCPTPADAGPDAGATDLGTGYVGANCTMDSECTQVPGMSCWTRNEPPFVWGYCTVSPCGMDSDCPGGSHCLAFNVGSCFSQADCPAGSTCQTGDCLLPGCLQGCAGEQDCRSDAFCLFISGLGYSICLPDCRDDLLDCQPRDGTVWCNRSSGQCELLAMQNASASVGDPCVSNADCGPGDVCMGDIAFTLPGGLCTHVCSGLPESSACDVGETCQDYLGVGLCFRDCVNNSCPNRANAVCTILDVNWVEPSCVPM